jgi:arginase
MVHIQVLQVPYDSGQRLVRHGTGPSALVRGGAVAQLAASGADVTTTEITIPGPFTTEVGGGVEVMRRTADAVMAAGRAAPVVLAGNCGASVGVMTAHARAHRRVGVLWLDAHGDLQTPETTTSGVFDGMGLALLTGRCWRALALTIPGFLPVPDEAAALIGGHALEPVEESLLRSSGMTWVSPGRLRAADGVVQEVVTRLATRVDALHVHIDLDVLDTSIAAANGYAAPGGLSGDEVRAVLRTASGRLPVISATLASWDPAYDVEDRILGVALEVLQEVGNVLVEG